MLKRPKTVWVLLAVSITLHLVVSRVVTGKQDTAARLIKRVLVDDDEHSHEWISQDYYASLPHALKPIYLLLLTTLLLLLFTSIGIVASDFFCPNLATVANHLGLSESTAGVTFLAFGNGSPDVFSTYSAVRGGTMGLAVGELIGAASFIVSIVVGTIALLRPFHVPRYPFIRDVSFFTAAVLLLIAVLADGKLTFWESGGMVILYILYVAVVVTGNWVMERKRREGEKAGWADEEVDLLRDPGEEEQAPAYDAVEPERPTLHLRIPTDDRPKITSRKSSSSLSPSTPRASQVSAGRGRSHSSAAQLSPHASGILYPTTSPLGQHPAQIDPLDHFPLDTPRPAFSLLGAIEFRDVVNSLRESASNSAGNSPNGLDPAADYFSTNPNFAAGHYHHHAHGHGHQQRHSIALGNAAAVTAGLATLGMHVPNPSPVQSRSEQFLFPDIQRRRTGRNRSISSHPSLNRAVSHEPPTTRDGLKVPARSSSGPHPVSSTSLSPVAVPVDSAPLQNESNPWEDTLSVADVASASSISNSSTIKPPKDGVRKTHVPRISLVDPSGEQFQPDGLMSPPPPTAAFARFGNQATKRTRFMRILTHVCHRLFPSLQSFRHKSWLGRILAVFVTPTVFALTISLPVVDDALRDEGGIALPQTDDEPLNEEWAGRDDDSEDGNMEDGEMARVGNELHHLIDGTFNPLHSPLGRLSKGRRSSGSIDSGAVTPVGVTPPLEVETETSSDDMSGFNKYLTALQCLMGPLLAVYIVFGVDFWILVPTAAAGLVLSLVVLYVATDGEGQPWRILRCFMGFIIAMVWIAAIADHVVDVLQAFGEILGLSDAIVGLTIFAVGNSLADLVANVTVARFAPAMAYAACFGGPMLNLLMGVGSAGTYFMLSDPNHAPITIEFSPTLWVSSSGLVLILFATAIFVPLNGFMIDRRWATCLIAAYVVLMITNIVVEIKTGRA